MQGLTGLYNQIEFPYLNNLQDAGEIVSIESATLYLYPQAGSYNKLNQHTAKLMQRHCKTVAASLQNCCSATAK